MVRGMEEVKVSHTVDDTIKHGTHRIESAVCEHDPRFRGVLFMPKMTHGCVACGFEQERAENERLRQELTVSYDGLQTAIHAKEDCENSAWNLRQRLNIVRQELEDQFERANEWRTQSEVMHQRATAAEAALADITQSREMWHERWGELEATLEAEKKLSNAISRDCNATALERNELWAALATARKDALLAAERLESIVAPMAHPEFSYSREVRKQIHLDIIDEAKILRALAQKED